MLSYAILGATYAFAAAVQPGQFQAYLNSQANTNGWRRALPAALAPILSDIPIICVTMVVLTQVPTLFIHLLQLAGGAFLLYLAFGALRSCRDRQQKLAVPPARMHQTVFKAALVNLLNPNPFLAWALIMGPLLIQAWGKTPANGIALLVAFYSMMLLSCAAIILLFSLARSLGPRVALVLVAVSSVALAGFGVYQLWSGSKGLLHPRASRLQPTLTACGQTPLHHWPPPVIGDAIIAR